MNVKGKLVEVFETQLIKETFRKREFVIEFAENAQYPEFIKFELVQDKCGLVDGLQLGTEVDVYFNLRGRSWVNAQGVKNYFNSLQAWKVTVDNPNTANKPAANHAGAAAPATDTFTKMNNSAPSADDDMPF